MLLETPFFFFFFVSYLFLASTGIPREVDPSERLNFRRTRELGNLAPNFIIVIIRFLHVVYPRASPIISLIFFADLSLPFFFFSFFFVIKEGGFFVRLLLLYLEMGWLSRGKRLAELYRFIEGYVGRFKHSGRVFLSKNDNSVGNMGECAGRYFEDERFFCPTIW